MAKKRKFYYKAQMTFIISAQDYEEMKKLAFLVRELNSQGHNPATSGNYSLRSKTNLEIALVSESRIDKSKFTENNFLPHYYQTRNMHSDYISSGRISSEETDIHLTIYQMTNANCVLHSHLLESLLFADMFQGLPFATISGLELLKGFKGVATHETVINIPCYDNTQDIKSLSEKMKITMLNDSHNYGLLLRGHGLYVWGESVEDAKRHLEVFQYVFKYYINSQKFGRS